MSILPLMILVSMLVVLGAGIAFFWAVEHDQFEDLKSPGFLPLLDDSAPDGQADGQADEQAAGATVGESAGNGPADRKLRHHPTS